MESTTDADFHHRPYAPVSTEGTSRCENVRRYLIKYPAAAPAIVFILCLSIMVLLFALIYVLKDKPEIESYKPVQLSVTSYVATPAICELEKLQVFCYQGFVNLSCPIGAPDPGPGNVKYYQRYIASSYIDQKDNFLQLLQQKYPLGSHWDGFVKDRACHFDVRDAARSDIVIIIVLLALMVTTAACLGIGCHWHAKAQQNANV